MAAGGAEAEADAALALAATSRAITSFCSQSATRSRIVWVLPPTTVDVGDAYLDAAEDDIPF